MDCKNCRVEITEGSRFCAHCGTDQTGSMPVLVVEQDARIGVTIEGKYRIDSKIGTGGMATVYRATRLLIGDTVAVKILHPEQLRDRQAPERFRREAQAAARLKHPNAVSIYDFGVSSDSLVYLVMELVDGDSLRTLLKAQGPLLPSAAAEIIAQACAALDEAHRQNIVHRDIKPDNLMVAMTPAGPRVKVLDFGIARLRDMSSMGNLTQTGSVMGTPHYMSPEQCLGEELDGRSDIYSLGIVLYEMLAGVVPFNSPTSMAVVVQHVNTTPASLRILNVSIPLGVETVVMHALEKKRESRPQTAGAWAEELSRVVSGGTLPIAAGSGTVAAVGSTGAGGFTPTIQLSTPWQTGVATPNQSPVSGQPTGRGQVRQPMASNKKALVAAGVAALVVAVLGSGGMAWYLVARKKPIPETTAIAEPSPVAETTLPPAPSTADSTAPPLPTTESATSAPLNTPPNPSTTTPTVAGSPRPISNAAALPGSLTVRSTRESSVSIDGASVGTTNSDGVLVIPRLQPGRHLIAIRKDHYRDEQRTITVAPGHTELLEASLGSLPGSLSVTTNVGAATFIVDGARSTSDQISALELQPGRHKVTASKAGFKSATSDVEIRSGETTRASLTLEALSSDDLVAEVRNDYQAGNFDKAATAAKRILNTDPQQPKANLYLGLASMQSKQFAESITYLSKAIDLGEEVSLPIKHHHGGFPSESYCEGIVKLTKKEFGFHSTTAGGHDFSVTTDKILEIRNEPQKASRVNVKVALKNGAKEDKKDYNFQNVGATLVNRGTGSVAMYSVVCQSCDDSMNVLFRLLEKIRNQR